jgi:putative transposase
MRRQGIVNLMDYRRNVPSVCMTKAARDPLYRRHRFPPEVIANAVWLYFRFPLSLRMVENLLAARGIVVSHQSVVSMGGEIRAVLC